MRRTKLVLSLVMAMLLASAIGLSALGLDVELKGGAGLAMGTTDDPNKSGEVRYALDAGLTLDLFILQPGSMAFGISAGAGYANLNFHGVDPGLIDPIDFTPTTQTSDSTYNYVLFPVALVGKFGIGAHHSLVVRGGGFAAYFLSGSTDLTYNPETTVFTDGPHTFNDTIQDTELWMYGLSFYAGLNLFTRGRLSISPSLEFNMGLTDTTINAAQPTPSKDTSWALTANVGIRYNILK